MTCQRCGKRDATVHLVELTDGLRKSLWLCDVCAGRSPEDGEDPPEFRFDRESGEPSPEDEDNSLAAFLGQVFEPGEDGGQPDPPDCTVCGYTLGRFRETNLLGCPHCYEAFRRPLLSILGHLHRHVSHLGKVPAHVDGLSDLSNALKRTRVALEKAIAAEDFESAARLRDEILRLESSGPPEGGSA